MTKMSIGPKVGRRTWRAFVAAAGAVLATGDICRAVWPRKSKFHPEEYKRVRLAAAEHLVERGRSRHRNTARRAIGEVKARFKMDEQEQVKIGMAWAATRAAATIVLKELVHVHGGIGPWFDELLHRTITVIKNTTVSGTPMEQDAQVIGTAVRVVEKIFDEVRDEATA